MKGWCIALRFMHPMLAMFAQPSVWALHLAEALGRFKATQLRVRDMR